MNKEEIKNSFSTKEQLLELVADLTISEQEKRENWTNFKLSDRVTNVSQPSV